MSDNLQTLYLLVTGAQDIRLWEKTQEGRHGISYINHEGRYRFVDYSDDDLASIDPKLADVVNSMLKKMKHVNGRALATTFNVHWHRKNSIVTIEDTDRLFNRFGKRPVLNRWFLNEIQAVRETGGDRLELGLDIYVISRTLGGVEYAKESRTATLVRPIAWLDQYVGSAQNLLASLNALDTPSNEIALHFQQSYLQRLGPRATKLELPGNWDFIAM